MSLPARSRACQRNGGSKRLAITVHDRYAEQASPGAIGLLETLDAVNTYPALPVRGTADLTAHLLQVLQVVAALVRGARTAALAGLDDLSHRHTGGP